ncbi:MAG: carbamoyltransferase C-terminal domain-containing protein [Bacillota bacterium]
MNYKFVANVEKYNAQKLHEGKIVGWFQGKMEIGARALDNRSILSNPTDENNQKSALLNLELFKKLMNDTLGFCFSEDSTRDKTNSNFYNELSRNLKNKKSNRFHVYSLPAYFFNTF